ncbi:MAG: PQQ-binding-like beta-propeller repeat protein [Spirochaetes bacterium]|nr:PQQ-binding-like beta-propeller repeat protein [Spirochaetota bacterium]
MTKPEHDMERAMESLRTKRRYRNIDHAKLARLAERAELNAPEAWLNSPSDPVALLTRIRDLPRRGRSAPFGIPKKAWWALVPAVAAAAIIILFITGAIDFMRGGRAGAAGIVSGDVMVRRGGIDRTLRAGNQILRGDVIITGAASSADIRFGGLVRMRVLGGSRIALRAMDLDGGARAFDAMVSKGGCVLDVARLASGETVSLHTPGSVATVRGTRFGVRIGKAGDVRYEVFEGTVRVRRRLPDDGPADAKTANILDRYFEKGALDVTGGQACDIGNDAVSLSGISGVPEKDLMASLAMPRLVRDAPVMREDMDRMVTSVTGAAPLQGGGKEVPRRKQGAREAVPEESGVFLMYVPGPDCVLRIGGGRLVSIRSDEVLWSVPLEGAISSLPAYEATSLYVPTAGGSVTKFDLLNGARVWKARAPAVRGEFIRLTMDGSGLYCASSGGTLSKIDRGGDVQWTSQTGEYISARPVITEQLAFVSTRAGSLYGFDLLNGAKSVRVSVGGGIVSITARKRNIFIAADTGRLSCYNFGEDRILWEYQLDDIPLGEMVLEGDSLYCFGRGGRIYRIGTGGELMWRRDIGVPIAKRPSEDGSSFYIPAPETLFVVDKNSGSVTWSLMVPQITSNNVTVSRGHIYFETWEKRLSSLKK